MDTLNKTGLNEVETAAETYVWRYAVPAILTVILVIVISRLINTILSVLVVKKRLSPTSKPFIMRSVNMFLISVALTVMAQTFFPHLPIYIFVAVASVIVFTLFYHTIREILAYFNLTLRKIPTKKLVAIIVPGLNKPLFGEILKIDPVSTEIYNEKLGNISIPNSLLVGSIIKECIAKIVLKINLKITEELSVMYRELSSVVKRIDVSGFRVEENIKIDEVSRDRVRFVVSIKPITSSYRISDLAKFLEDLINDEYVRRREPLIEVEEVIE